ncbi:hypothetical protein GLYMA_14G103600v4 [Glycine max]|uniref:Uncharacterized protein n=2 Tax=Glycine subgen. Soja TaxID=1462606 RepID=A0A0R0GNC4_SOYBN|nr:transcription initiation factor TFIID subunit 5 isoform X1 [Glycine max]XP_006596048.1 transcription initiation factor TFIID subunit 5 isoform X1 [Glycine max]XP_006596049.1 transcription initiation factor TFIID subunit 5 isoform X1 [Glycine max]XP_028198684.1 transcription initiation factor TFIID subunit 5-like isoform X1 [Glycine soja]XP_028198685.1 transcription initiation factor TFIID subunit 5-like isoform X1 [Glycine soja]XP_028198686.1 transcription initiation factor TFIID subunit 5-|eukprot:XP_006596046.1 transcription initiation factor TFIID subunit 5 [Glycine max]
MILSLAMSPDGLNLASGDEDGTIMIWDLSSGCCITPLVGHTSCVWSLTFSCEGSLLASGSADCTVKFGDVTTEVGILTDSDHRKACLPNLLQFTLSSFLEGIFFLQLELLQKVADSVSSNFKVTILT